MVKLSNDYKQQWLRKVMMMIIIIIIISLSLFDKNTPQILQLNNTTNNYNFNIK